MAFQKLTTSMPLPAAPSTGSTPSAALPSVGSALGTAASTVGTLVFPQATSTANVAQAVKGVLNPTSPQDALRSIATLGKEYLKNVERTAREQRAVEEAEKQKQKAEEERAAKLREQQEKKEADDKRGKAEEAARLARDEQERLMRNRDNDSRRFASQDRLRERLRRLGADPDAPV